MRAVCNVATGSYVRGQQRLRRAVHDQADFLAWADEMPPRSPSHGDVPYAFKSHALRFAAERGYKTLLWADASILPVQPLASLFDLIESKGYWVSNNGYRNSEWTCEAAYPLLGVTKEENHEIKHVVATSFGVSLDHKTGRDVLEMYCHFGNNGSFRGPWKGGVGVQHRHDQTALSVVCARLGVELTDPPKWLAYAENGKPPHPETVLQVNGSY